MGESEGETICSDSWISEDESLHSSDKDFFHDSETEDSESETKTEEHVPEYKKKLKKLEINIKI